jgi:hypothetical protein
MRVRDQGMQWGRYAGAGLMVASMAACLWMLPARAATAPTDPVESQKTAEGAVAFDHHWSLAEYMGDTTWLNQALLPDYRSVNADGKAYSKERIVAGAAKRGHDTLAQAQAEMEAYRKDHPDGTSVVMQGDTAILSFYDAKRGKQDGVMSSDILVYVDGQWHALYSQHGDPEKK